VSRKAKIAIISNLIRGGSVVYRDNVVDKIVLEHKEYFPRQVSRSKNKLLNFVFYLKYIYFDLVIDYYRIAKILNSDINIEKVIVFQDGYIKAPYALGFLNKKSIYVLHEPPREFYEPLSLHAPTILSKMFNFVRIPIKFFDYYLTRKASVIISNSYYSEEVIKKTYDKQSVVIYPGIKKFLLGTKNKTRKRICISMGSLLPYKGHALTIEAISNIRKNRPVLIIIGDGTEILKKELIDYSKKLGVKLILIKEVDEKRLESLYLTARVYVNSAYKEPFGMTSLEAVSLGCYLVTIDSGGTKELKKIYKDKVQIFSNVKNATELIENCLLFKNTIPRHEKKFDWKYVAKKIINQ